MAENRKGSSRRPSQPVTRPAPRARDDGGAAPIRSADLAALAQSFAAMKLRLADTEAALQREKLERAGDADTIAEMLVRIAGLERSLREAAAREGKARSLAPSTVDPEAARRAAALEERVDEAERKARDADARAAADRAHARALERSLADVVGERDDLRARFAEAEIRARSEADRAARGDELTRSAKARAIELTERLQEMDVELANARSTARAAEERARAADDRLANREGRDLDGARAAARLSEDLDVARLQLEHARTARDAVHAALVADRAHHERELEEERERSAASLREVRASHAVALAAAVDEERERVRRELEAVRAELREGEAAHAALEDRVRSADAKAEADVARLRHELSLLAHDRDAADRQAGLVEMQLRAATAKLELVDRQLEWAEESVATVGAALAGQSGAVREAVEGLIDRLSAARGALFVEEVAEGDRTPPPVRAEPAAAPRPKPNGPKKGGKNKKPKIRRR